MRSCVRRRLTGGVVLLLIGTAFLLRNLGVINESLFQTWWPLLLIAAGVAKLLTVRGFSRPTKPYTDFRSA